MILFRWKVDVVRLVLAVAILFTGAAAAVFRSAPIVFMAALLWSAPLTVMFVGRLSGRGLKLSRLLPTSGTVGETIAGRLTLRNERRFPAFLVRVQAGETSADGLSAVQAVGGDERVVPLLRGGEREEWNQEWQLKRRGFLVLPPARVGAADPLGLWRKMEGKTAPHEMLVLPRAVKIDRLGLFSRAASGMATPRFAAAVADATDFHGVRAWRPGEGIRRAHWKSTARTGVLHVVEWEEDAASDLAVLLDVAALASLQSPVDSLDALETGITIAASLASHLLQNGYEMQLFFWDAASSGRASEGAPPTLRRLQGRSLSGLHSVLEALACIPPAGGLAVEGTPKRHSAKQAAAAQSAADLDASLLHLVQRASASVPPGRETLLLSATTAPWQNALRVLGARSSGPRPRALLLDADSFRQAAPASQEAASTESAFAAQAGSVSLLEPGVRVIGRGESLAEVLEHAW